MCKKSKIDSIIGKKYNYLTIISAKYNDKYQLMATAKCDCGNIKVCDFHSIETGQTKSCGCKRTINRYTINLDDLIGQKFGKLTIQSARRAEDNTIFVTAKCECGNVKEYRWKSLQSGRTKSCGCINFKINLDDLIGQKYGKLTILKAERRLDAKNHNKIIVTAQCECGNIKEYDFSNVKRGNTKHCGCSRNTKFNLDELKGQKFGKLTILDAYRNDKSQIIAHTKCECGNEKDILYISLKNGLTNSCGCMTRNQIDTNTLIGQKFGKLTITKAWRDENKNIFVTAKCECGGECTHRYNNIKSGEIQSCGCTKYDNTLLKTDDYSKLIGQKFNQLTIKSAYKKNKVMYVIAKCECGSVKEYLLRSLLTNHTKSCGCVVKNTAEDERLYSIWHNIKNRCYNKKYRRYADWGGRGITMCEAWKNDFLVFKTWALANGYTDELTIDRIDNDKNYCPENCRWITQKEQNRNKRNSIRVIFHGKDQSLKTLCEDLQLDYENIKRQYQKGKDVIHILEAQYQFLK